MSDAATKEFSVIGKSVPKIDAREKVIGKARYTGDLKVPGMLIGKILRSPHAHARVSALILHCPAAPGKVKASSPPRAIFDTLMRSDFVYWAFITYFRPYSIVGVPKEFILTPEFEAAVKDILAKTLPLSERMDGFINVRGLAERLPNARLYVVPDGGSPLLGHSEEVKAEITQFLRDNMALLRDSE